MQIVLLKGLHLQVAALLPHLLCGDPAAAILCGAVGLVREYVELTWLLWQFCFNLCHLLLQLRRCLARCIGTRLDLLRRLLS